MQTEPGLEQQQQQHDEAQKVGGRRGRVSSAGAEQQPVVRADR
jgi:hypothetical protein